MESSALTWARDELCSASLGDQRRTKRAVTVLAQRAADPNASLARAAGTEAAAEATYRFFANDDVDPGAVLAAHQRATQQRLAAANTPVILAVQDTTEADFSRHPAIAGIGVVQSPTRAGLLVHTTLAVTPQRVPLGLVDQQVWTRPAETLGKRPPHDSRPISDKESQKWLTSLRRTAAMQTHLPNTRIVSVGDREADIYDLFQLAQTLGQDVLVRASWDRRVAHPEGHLWAYLEAQASAGEVTITTPRHEQTPSRTATLAVRCASVTLRPPKKRRDEHLPTISVWAILAQEESAPPGITPIHWLLLTTVPTTTFEQTCERIQWYACRWVVEMYHKVLKSGCRIERRQFDDLKNIRRYLVVDGIVAWRVLYLTMQGREMPNLPCTVLFETAEWQALYMFTFKSKTLPAAIPTVAEVILWIAQLGGYTDRRKNAHPGTTVIWRGLARMSDIAAAWQVFNSLIQM
jgi:hypothetical protein